MQVSIQDLKNYFSQKLRKKSFIIEGLRWNGKKPVGSEKCPKIIGKTAAEMVLEDRLETLLSQVSTKNLHSEEDSGSSLGKEAW